MRCSAASRSGWRPWPEPAPGAAQHDHGEGSSHAERDQHDAPPAAKTSSSQAPLFSELIERFGDTGVAVPGAAARTLSAGEAFVLTHAMAGGPRAMVSAPSPPPRQQVEDALVQLVLGFLDQGTKR